MTSTSCEHKEYPRVSKIILDRRVRVSILGCGRISENHLKSTKEIPDFELVGVCDSVPSVADAVAQKYQTQAFYSLDELAHTDTDIVSICTPSGLHADQAIRLACYGKHVITEKPMATQYHAALSMVHVCENENVWLFVVKQNRLNPTIQLLKKAIQLGRFGRIFMVNANVFWTRPQEYYDQASWRGKWDMDGGAFMNQASHYFDLLYWLIGPVNTVSALTGTLARNIEAEDTGVVNIKWRNGALGSMAVTMLTYPKNYEGSITILGERGSVKIGGIAVNKVEHWEFADKHPMDDEVKLSNYDTKSVYGSGHLLFYQNILNVLRGKEKPVTCGREGLKSLEFIVAAYRAARDQKMIHIPLEM